MYAIFNVEVIFHLGVRTKSHYLAFTLFFAHGVVWLQKSDFGHPKNLAKFSAKASRVVLDLILTLFQTIVYWVQVNVANVDDPDLCLGSTNRNLV